MKKIALSLGLALTILTGCSSMPQTDHIKANQSNAVMVEFVGQGSYSIQPQRGTVSLYAVESRMADVPATLIQQKKVQVSQVPFRVEFNLPTDHLKLIRPPVNGNAEVTYYVTWESDMKNLPGKDAIVIDYDRKFPRVTLNGAKQQIYLREAK